jgi:hypothetical protein
MENLPPYQSRDYHTKHPSMFGAIMWQEFWEVVAGMQGLKVLNVFSTFIGPAFVKKKTVNDLLKPMRGSHTLRRVHRRTESHHPGAPHIASPFKLRVLNTGGDGEFFIPSD